MTKNYYDVLGVGRNATQDDIKKAFRELSKKYHPDRKDGNEEKFKEVNEAYSTLSDENKRKEYDYMNGGSNSWFNGFKNHFGGFGNMYSDIQVQVEVPIEYAYYGCTRQVQAGNRLLNVDIPKGVVTGQKLRVEGFGNEGYDMYGNIRKGDLIVTVIVKSTDKIWLNNDGSLEVICSIDWVDAILGGETTRKIFDRDITFRIPRYTQNGGYTILSNSGYRKLNTDEFGILKINFIVKMPKSLNDTQVKLLEKIKESQN